MQKLTPHKPVKLVTDKSENFNGADEGTFIKNYRVSFNKNPLNNGEEGGNYGVGTAFNSTIAIPNINKPEGINIPIGGTNAEETNELYLLYWNSNKLHTIFVVDGFTQKVSLVDIGSHLGFSIDPKLRIPPHRIHLRVLYNSDKLNERVVKEKILIWTNGKAWQGWVNVMAGVGTKGFDPVSFPYFKLKYPHFDRRELSEYAVRPPMLKPVVTPIDILPEDIGKPNNIVDKSIQFAIVYELTDGRTTTLSPYSIPYIHVREGFSLSASMAPRCLDLKLYAGSPLVEKIFLLQRLCGGDWYLYDVIDKFSNCGSNSKEQIGNNYWLRTNAWENLNYDEASNTISYKYCGEREINLYSADDARRWQTDLPIQSIGISPAGDAVLLGDNKYGYDNISCDILNKIKISVSTNADDQICETKLINIKLYAYISRQEQYTQPIWKRGENGDRFFGGGFRSRLNSPTNYEPYKILTNESEAFNLNLGEKDGMICYLAGTPYRTIGKQYQVINGQKSFVGVFDLNDSATEGRIRSVIEQNGYFVQEFEFNVPAGNYIARLASHLANEDGDYSKTSTYVQAIVYTDFLAAFKLPNGQVTKDQDKAKEIVINACDANIDYWNNNSLGQGIFHVYCPALFDFETWSGGAFGGRTKILGRFIEGYVYEDTIDKIPVERIRYEAFRGDPKYNKSGWFTDHNGFFFTTSSDGSSDRSEVLFKTAYNCQPYHPDNARFTTNIGNNSERYYPNQIMYFKQSMGNSYGPCNRIEIRGRIVDNKTGQGLSGVGVTLEDTNTYYTDSQGYFSVISHPYNDVNINRKIFYNSVENFRSADCSCISPDTYNEGLVPCNNCQIRVWSTTILKRFKRAQTGGVKTHKEGGRYGVSIAIGDLAGRTTYANNVGYLDMPSIVDMGKIIPLRIKWEIDGVIIFEDWMKWISILVTTNLISKKYLQWVGDKIEFLDNNGNTTSSGNGAILAKISIQSLFEYNTQNNLSTNTSYQFVPGDVIRIYDNGSGEFFPSTNPGGFMDFQVRGTNFNAVVNDNVPGENEDGKHVIIDYDSRLLKLSNKCGFWIQIMSPKQVTDREDYCEVITYPIINGKIDGGRESDILESFDAYFTLRNFTISECSGNAISHPFISSSISDFFGSNCNSCGRVLVKDDGAKQMWYSDDVIKSDDLVNEGRVNGLGTFREENRKQFKGQEWGGIVAIHAERGLVVFICANDWFITDYNQNYVRASADGILTVNLDRNLSDPNQKAGSNYGCSFEDTATIDFFDGLCLWADSKNSAVIVMNYNTAEKISLIDNASYFLNKFRYVTEFNNKLPKSEYLNNLIEICGGVDPQGRNYHLTFRPRRNLARGAQHFVNNEWESFIDMQETMVFSLDQKCWIGQTAYTPELYLRFIHSTTGEEMVSAAAGDVHYHNSKSVKTVNTFYGIKTDQVLEIVCVGEEQKDKLLQGISQDSRGISYLVDSVKSNMPNVYSYVPKSYFKRKEGVYYASILRNTNTYPNTTNKKESNLIEGGVISGLWFKLRLVRDINFRDSYNELNYLFLRFITREKSKK